MTAQKQSSDNAALKERVEEEQQAASASETKEMPTPEARHRMIAEAAYCIAEQRNFQGGSAEEDWLQAEQTVDAQNSES